MPSIRFLGAAGTVTGSRYLVRAHGRQVLVDAGLFQGAKDLRLRNWAPFPVPPSSLDAVVLTHAHIDHTGALPLLTRSGFRGPAFCTPATRDLARLMLPDSGRLQEEEARYANKKGYSRHAPNALPLYTEQDALGARSAGSCPSRTARRREIVPGITVALRRAGHILGSATVEMELAPEGSAMAVRLLFSRRPRTLRRAHPPRPRAGARGRRAARGVHLRRPAPPAGEPGDGAPRRRSCARSPGAAPWSCPPSPSAAPRRSSSSCASWRRRAHPRAAGLRGLAHGRGRDADLPRPPRGSRRRDGPPASRAASSRSGPPA